MARSPRLEQIEALLAEDPQDAFLNYGLAMEHMSLGDDEKAVVLLKNLISLKATDPYIPAYLQAGQVLIRLGRDKEAAQILRQGIEAARQVGDTHALGEMQGFLSTIE